MARPGMRIFRSSQAAQPSTPGERTPITAPKRTVGGRIKSVSNVWERAISALSNFSPTITMTNDETGVSPLVNAMEVQHAPFVSALGGGKDWYRRVRGSATAAIV